MEETLGVLNSSLADGDAGGNTTAGSPFSSSLLPCFSDWAHSELCPKMAYKVS